MEGGSGGVPQAATPVQQTDATNSTESIFFLVEIAFMLITADGLGFLLYEDKWTIMTCCCNKSNSQADIASIHFHSI
jgi:hypothetical protein